MKEKASLRIIRMWSANYNEIQGGFFNMSQYTDDLHSLPHTKWNCKYHVVFAPKYRRKAFYEARMHSPEKRNGSSGLTARRPASVERCKMAVTRD